MSGPLAGRPVLLLGSGLTVLGVLRILHAAGAEVLAPPDVDPLPQRSRLYRPGPAALAGATPATLAARLGALPDSTVLLPCSDSWLRAVGGLLPELSRRFPASVASLEALETLTDKSLLARALDRLELPHPHTLSPVTPDHLASVPDEILTFSFLKPADSQAFFARFGAKAFRITGRSEAVERLAQCAAAGFSMVLQEYVAGPPVNHYYIEGFIDREGITRARFARRRLRMYPPDFGNSTFMVSVPLRDVSDGVEALDVLLADLRYRGIFSAEFKRDDRSGRLKLLEVNARPWWYVEFAARCGVDVCRLAVLDALGDPVPDITRYAVGRRCVYPYYDFLAARAEWRAGRLGLLTWVRSWLGAQQPVFRWSDPWPALGEIGRAFARKVS